MPESTHKTYKVRDGDCITSIAKAHGMRWQAIWDDPKNEELKALRQDPNVLSPGDVVRIREKETKQEPCAPEQRHRFRLLGEPAMVRLRLMDEDVPRANEAYKLEVADRVYEGTTDGDGQLEHPIPNEATSATLTVGNDPDAQDVFKLRLGTMDPVREVRGVQKRLFNLGFDPGPIDGQLGPQTEAALRDFQKKHEDLTETGLPDAQTGAKLVEQHGN